MKKKMYTVIVLSLLAYGCDKSEEVHPISWYEQHDTERKSMLEECADNPGKRMPGCENASKAESHVRDSTESKNLNLTPLPPR